MANFSETYLKGPKAKKFLWNLTIRLRGQEVPLELISISFLPSLVI
jgi:hypothetical protein